MAPLVRGRSMPARNGRRLLAHYSELFTNARRVPRSRFFERCRQHFLVAEGPTANAILLGRVCDLEAAPGA
ncbi:hypothetical protein FQZ97_725640 [compost metagenome]